MANNSIQVRSPFATGDTSLPLYALTDTEKAILAMSSLTGWWEADYALERYSGFRLEAKNAPLRAQPFEALAPLVVTGSHGQPALQMSYGDSRFTSTDRGMLRLPSGVDYLGATGFTVVTACRLGPSGETGGLGGGYIWACEGAATTSTPRLNISNANGKPNFTAGGKTISNPTGDLRDGAWHIVSARLNTVTGAISVRADKARSVGTNTAATTQVPAGSRRPVIGRYNSLNASPFYGQESGWLTFNTSLSDGELLVVETYLAGKYGAVLV